MLICFPIIIINARLVPLQPALESISIDNILNLPLVVPNHRLGKRQTTTPPRANTTVCYPLVGCFDNNEPFNNAGFEVPQSPDFISTAFLLFTQEAPNVPEFLAYDGTDDSLAQSSINPSRWLRIIIHGFTNNRDSVWIKPLKEALMSLTDVRTNQWISLPPSLIDLGSGIGCPGDRLGTRSEISGLQQCCIKYSSGRQTDRSASQSIGTTERPLFG